MTKLISFQRKNKIEKPVRLIVMELIAILLCIPLGYICSKFDFLNNHTTEIILFIVPLSMLSVGYLHIYLTKKNK
ncbi:hypothetical protein D6029_20065 [Buttiauxella izardii]|uniref:Uncharacterized protein n=1 Tax=Buttiauxella izardii TaxID=82991 RepID=A0A3A5JMA9_9ENTR|nr:hypothetical protein D6029_20065 [Buttiauxella izardii]